MSGRHHGPAGRYFTVDAQRYRVQFGDRRFELLSDWTNAEPCAACAANGHLILVGNQSVARRVWQRRIPPLQPKISPPPPPPQTPLLPSSAK